MILIVLASTMSTKSATTPSTISVTTRRLLFVDERGCALDLHDLDTCAGLEHLVLHVRPRGPFLAADPDAAAVRVDALQHERLRAHERVRARTNCGRELQVPLRDRPHRRHRRERAHDEDDQLKR